MPVRIKRTGWIPDIPDQRDYKYTPSQDFIKIQSTPPKINLKDNQEYKLKVFNQGDLGSCTAQAISNAFRFCMIKQSGGRKVFFPSRLFIYYNERKIEGTINSDSGAMIRDGFKAIKRDGVCRERMWPYIIDRFKVQPHGRCYIFGQSYQAIQYARVNRDLNDFKQCLAEGYPFVFGFMVYESFESPEVERTGIAPMPQIKEQALGGHAVLCVGYDDEIQRFILMNSWGVKWGDNGYFTLPYEYLTNSDLSDDFWTLRMVES